GVGALVGAVLVYRPSPRAGWWLIALSGLLTYGEAVVISATSGLGAGERLTTVAQLALAILALVALAAGLAVLGWRSPRSGWLNSLDVAIIATGAFLLAWVLYIDSTLTRSASGFGTITAI